MEKSLKKSLEERIKGHTLIIGVGNTLRGDDGLGPLMVEKLNGRVKVDLLDAGEVPESYLGRIIDSRPDTVIVVDAVQMEEIPGTLAIIEVTELEKVSWSTHRLSLALFMKYVHQHIGCSVFLIGVQPGTTEMGHEMTPEVDESLAALVQYFTALFGK
ncbi:hydrogenase 3 maturation endopeptidase HyCI [Dehalobacter sp. DCM]|uniref:hydrogenase 3 maturation endopeptidase HyCI n=1 Tax=Dehalobacter sp. DCM TaxID=2907827 RepID=UPI003081CA8F|nr:hydrogenase 3 maturation endopeptidase HyCI [Dehalobacter sp. DCM]